MINFYTFSSHMVLLSSSGYIKWSMKSMFCFSRINCYSIYCFKIHSNKKILKFTCNKCTHTTAERADDILLKHCKFIE